MPNHKGKSPDIEPHIRRRARVGLNTKTMALKKRRRGRRFLTSGGRQCGGRASSLTGGGIWQYGVRNDYRYGFF